MSDGPQRKTCSQCGEAKPLEDFHRRSERPGAYRADCKACVRARNNRWAAENREQKNAHQRAYARANREKANAWWKAHPETKRASSAAYYARNRERILVRSREYNAAHREGRLAQRRRYYVAHRAEVLRKLAQRYRADWAAARARRRRWAAANPERVAEYFARRRARKRAAFVAPVDFWAIYARDGGRCHICGEPVPRRTGGADGASLDHLVPLSRGGVHAPWNVRLAHVLCNQRRHSGWIPAQLLLPLEG